MKLIFKILLGLTAVMILLVIIFNQNIPAFIFNEWETYARFNYYMAETAKEALNNTMSARAGQDNLLMTDQKKPLASKDIRDILTEREFFINEYFRLNAKQAKLPFLPKKYQEYHRLKTEAFRNYQTGFYNFKKMSQFQEEVISFNFKVDNLKDQFFSTLSQSFKNNDSSYQKHLGDIYLIAQSNLKEANDLYSKGALDENSHKYYQYHCHTVIDTYEYLLKIKDEDNSETYESDIAAIAAWPSGLPDETTVFIQWQENILIGLFDDMEAAHSLAFDQMIQADQYYKDNKLGDDLISKLLSLVSDRFPRNI